MVGVQEKYGINWKGQLEWIVESHRNLQRAYGDFLTCLGGKITDSEGNSFFLDEAYNQLRGSLSVVFNTVRPKFKEYLGSEQFTKDFEKNKITIDDFDNVCADYRQEKIGIAIVVVRVLLYWLNAYGPLAIYVQEETYDTFEEELEAKGA